MKLFSKSPKYRENNNISCEEAKSSIMEVLNDGIDTWCNKHGIDKYILKMKI